MNKNREKFYNDISKFIDEGIVKEIFSNEELCILNFSDFYYVVCPYIFTDENHSFGLITNAENAKEIAEDNIKLFYTLRTFDKDYFQKGTLELSEENYNNIKKFVSINQNNRPSKFINYDIEQEIMNMNKGKTI